MSLRSFAPAKINLSLHVGPARADGRHPLESVVAFADVGDWVWAEAADRPSLNLAGPFAAQLASEADNLVIRAAQLLVRETGVRKGVALTLEKNLPIASGIGGGSSDAAATLRVLNRLWGLGLSAEDLERLGAQLGADVPACVRARACYMTGGGEEIAPIHLPPLAALLVNPGAPAPTGAVYRAFDARGGGGGFTRAPAPDWSNADAGAVRAALGAMRNDLTDAAIDVAPSIADVITALQSDPEARLVRLSGSGASLFALTDDLIAARRVAERVREAHPDWWMKPVRLAPPRAVLDVG